MGGIANDDKSLFQLDRVFCELPTSRDKRWELLRQFFAAWFGGLRVSDQCDLCSIVDAEDRLQLKLPAALREWYALAGRRQSVWSVQDRFLEPEKLYVQDGKLIVCIENQGVVCWGIPLELLPFDDPAVFVSDVDNESRWVEEAPSISVFALSQMLLDAKFASTTVYAANGGATDESLAVISESYQRLDFADLNWPPGPTRFYAFEDVLIETDADTWIWVGAMSPTNFRSVVERISRAGVEWEQVTGL